MEQKFMTAEEAVNQFGTDSRWIKGNLVGATIPDGTYETGAVIAKEYEIRGNTGKYPLLQLKGHGEITGNQIFANDAVAVGVPEGETATPEHYVVAGNDGKTFRINTAPINPQFAGTPIAALLELQGKRITIQGMNVMVATEFPKGDARTKKKMVEIAGKMVPKRAYKVLAVKSLT